MWRAAKRAAAAMGKGAAAASGSTHSPALGAASNTGKNAARGGQGQRRPLHAHGRLDHAPLRAELQATAIAARRTTRAGAGANEGAANSAVVATVDMVKALRHAG
eukprot:CAMPEP_0181385372 /NCGR_PEP_ID=MMETSP1106-20121128/22518_1 /TAXON_ID=81844 /ORGANISM="Mantoniella antarctica, Strain SL-175" /LENGTH=104 /DNA_ID=CAMNT_0023505415 /DNA_START=91 /DNA_END=402 /DNA_ORIENTATION=+